MVVEPLAGQSEADRIREFLAARDLPCPTCMYNLRGAGTGPPPHVCPECGTPLDLDRLRQAAVMPANPALHATMFLGLAGIAISGWLTLLALGTGDDTFMLMGALAIVVVGGAWGFVYACLAHHEDPRRREVRVSRGLAAAFAAILGACTLVALVRWLW